MANEIPVIASGNLTADPELRFTPNAVGWARFTVAVTPRQFDKAQNKWVDGEATFLACVAWREMAEHVAASLNKGSRVLVTGRLRQRHWTTDDGEKRSAFQLDVDDVGPSLRWATATPVKATRGGPGGQNTPPPEDPWSVPVGAPSDAPPF